MTGIHPPVAAWLLNHSHVLVLKAGRVLATGSKQSVLNPGLLARAFNVRLRLTSASRRHFMTVVTRRRVVV